VAVEVHDNENGAGKIHRVGEEDREAHETDTNQNVVVAPNETRRH